MSAQGEVQETILTSVAQPLDLAEVESRHRQILNSAIDTAIISTDLQGKILTWSAGAEHILGWTEGEIIGQNLDCIFTQGDVSAGLLRAEIQEAVSKGRGGHEGWRLRKGGVAFWAAGEMTPIRDKSGLVVGLVKVLRDHTSQKASERALRESEEYLRQIAEALPGYTWATDKHGKIEYTSSRWEQHTGTSVSRAIGDGWKRALHVDDFDRIERLWNAAVLNGEPYEAEMRYVHVDGSARWFLSRALPLRDDDGVIFRWIGVSVDIQDQKLAQEQNREEARVLEILNKAGSTLATETDIEPLVQAVTDAGVELTKAEFGAFFYNVENEQGESYMLYALAGVDREAFSKFPMPRNTAIFAPTFTGSRIVRSDDITKDPSYGKSGPHFGMPVGHLPVRSYLAIPAISRSGATLGGLFFGHSKPGVFNRRSEALVSSLAAEAAIVIDNARLFQGMQREVRERKQAEEALQKFNATLEQQILERSEQLRINEEALRQSQKMEAVGQLTGGVAHDFNNLLQIITGNLELLQRKLPKDADRLLRAVTQAMTGARRAAALTRHLLAFSRRQPLDPKPTNPKDLIGRTSKLLSRTLGEKIEIATNIPDDLWNVEVDENEMESALLNLSVNSRDAMPDGGTLSITAANVVIHDTPFSLNRDLTAGEYVRLLVADTGIGMAPQTLSRVFEPFFTTKPVGKGTGLGLSQVYGFIKQSGGHISINSVLGSGTTIEIHLPRFEGALGELDHDVTDETPLPKGRPEETVLVIEDDNDVRAFSVESLRDLGYHVIEAHDGESALHILNRDIVVDLVFSDVILPGNLTGADIAKLAREIRPHIKVLFTSGYARDVIVHDGRLDKGVQLLPKPFSSAELASKVRSALDA